MTKRSYQPEWIDLGPNYYTLQEYQDCLYQLDRVGKLLGGDRATFWAFEQLKSKPSSILDVGCGGGLFTTRLALQYTDTQVLGIDLSPVAITFAQKYLAAQSNHLSNLNFVATTSPHLSYSPGQFDVITSTLVCHHMTDEELIDFLKQSCQIAKQAIILNDLHRHWLATSGFAILAPLLFHNRLMTHDGLLSIKRAFTRQDWQSYLTLAGIDSCYYTITWHWAFRWVVFIDTSRLRSNKYAI